MKSAAVSELKASLSEYLAKVKKGEELIVTDRGCPVARLVPFRMKGGPQSSEREMLAREGIVELGSSGRIPKEFLELSSVKDSSDFMLRSLLAERDEKR